jgi:hypothetical protein
VTLYAARPSSAGVITIQNNSPSVTALNISVVDLSLYPGLTQDASNCQVVNPGATCTLLIYPGTSAVSPSPITIQGANTSSFVINVEVVLPPLHRVAVGIAVNALSVQVPMAYVSDDGGGTWSVPASSVISPSGGSVNTLFSVTCSSSGLSCSAVGSTTIGGVSLPLSYHSVDGGLNWSIPYLPARPGSNTKNFLHSVSCSDLGMLCTAVGSTANTRNNPLTYYSLDGGVSWLTPVALPSPVGTNSRLLGVSCSSSGLHCVAVGFSVTASIATPLTYVSTDGGKNWGAAVQPTPPVDQLGTEYSSLQSVSCSADGMTCVAVGYSQDNNTVLLSALSYTSTDGGVTWSAPIILPANGTTDNELLGVNCSNSGLLCTAVGIINVTSTQGNLSYTSKDGGNTWSAPILPQGPGGLGDSINGVFCDGSGLFCTAVGASLNSIYSYFSSNSGLNWGSLVLIPTPGFTSPNISAISGSR